MRDNRDILDKLHWLSTDMEYMEVPGEWLPPVTEAANEIERLRAALRLLHDNVVHAWPSLADLGPLANARAALEEK